MKAPNTEHLQEPQKSWSWGEKVFSCRRLAREHVLYAELCCALMVCYIELNVIFKPMIWIIYILCNALLLYSILFCSILSCFIFFFLRLWYKIVSHESLMRSHSFLLYCVAVNYCNLFHVQLMNGIFCALPLWTLSCSHSRAQAFSEASSCGTCLEEVSCSLLQSQRSLTAEQTKLLTTCALKTGEVFEDLGDLATGHFGS
jgi:hypothetical protein